MTNFFDDLDQDALSSGKYEVEEKKDFGPLPEGDYVCAVDTVSWRAFNVSETTLNIMWRVQEGDFENRVIFQKLLLDGAGKFDQPEKVAAKRKKARNMFAMVCKLGNAEHIIDGIRATGEFPQDYVLAEALEGTVAVLNTRIWSMDGDDGQKREGNWVSGIKSNTVVAKPVVAPNPVAPAKPKARVDMSQPVFTGAPATLDELRTMGRSFKDDEIPF